MNDRGKPDPKEDIQISTEPRPGYRSTIYMEMVDEVGKRMSDTTVTWYGGDGVGGRMLHNSIQTSLVDAVNATVKAWNEALKG